MRALMRRTFDELWILDLEGDDLGARKTENVFHIQSPVAIAIGVRYNETRPDAPGKVFYTRLEGAQAVKLNTLHDVKTFKDLKWRTCLPGWTDYFLPVSESPWWQMPLLTDIFPWQENGMQFKRTWVISEKPNALERRWKKLLSATTLAERSKLFKETRDRKVNKYYPSLADSIQLPALTDLDSNAPCPQPSFISYRSFDRQWALVDNRLGDYLRPGLQNAHGERQIYLTSLLTKVLGEGPAAIAISLLPDLDTFCGRGAKDIIPLWRNAEGTKANLVNGALTVLKNAYGVEVCPEDVFAYTYAMLFAPRYVEIFWEELTIPGPRLPFTRREDLFQRGAQLGKRLIWLHTYGERFVPDGVQAGKVPQGTARCQKGTSDRPEDYPKDFHYDAASQTLTIGTSGVFTQLRPEVWNFSVSGLQVVKSWLDTGCASGPARSLRRWMIFAQNDGLLMMNCWICCGCWTQPLP